MDDKKRKELFSKLFYTRDQIHFWHLETTSYAEHKALDTLYNEILTLTDELVETCFGKGGRISFGGVTMKFSEYNKETVRTYLKSLANYIGGEAREIYDKDKDTDILNILDEINILINRTSYMLTLE